ncbi:D-threonate kinase [Klebsiella sp. WOUb02]|uniref:D-threonate kinase n=1 Tax=Klebsiella sp. WOUb02 TaxID=3161071 RepID=UPI003CFA95FF
MKMIVIADDFTGANDTGVQLAKKGARTEVVLNTASRHQPRSDVLVINTESRALPAEKARQTLNDMLQPWYREGVAPPLIYKKIDSTFRGNVGAEIDAALQLSGARLAIVAAAIPAAGRTTLNGECLVWQVPLVETEFASDPKTPITSSRIKTVIGQQSARVVHEIGLDVIRDGQLIPHLAALAASSDTAGIAVLDSESDEDLRAIADAVAALHFPYLLVGAAGLANALPASLYLDPVKSLPVLVVAGSMSEATRRQIILAEQEKHLSVIDIEVESLLAAADGQVIQPLIAQAVAILDRGEHCVLRTCRDEAARSRIDALCQRYQLTRTQLGETIGNWLGKLTQEIIARTRIGGLFLTGGDIAIAIARALGAQGYRISSEVTPCVPCGTFVNSDIDDLPVITKAGGFGDDRTLCNALNFIEEMYSGN